jgi:oligopeptide/dipeptide ABC transporter ATP-binding protein
MTQSLVQAHDLQAHFPVGGGVLGRPTGHVHAVDGVDLDIARGETLGLVGESGCGKSTLGRLLLGLIPPTGGTVEFEGVDVTAARGGERRRLRREMQIVFQDPVGSLNPRMRVGDIVAEGLVSNRIGTRASRRRDVVEMLDRVGLPAEVVKRYPHEFSGGQRQRIVIARALALRPRFVVADEPVSALDVSIRSQVLNLLVDLKRELDLTYLFVAHDLAVVGYISDRIAVMYLGRVVETAPAAVLLRAPLHPYTHALLASVPQPKLGPRPRRSIVRGDVPDPMSPPSGCPFRTRCPMAQDVCAEVVPPLVAHGTDGHLAACHFPQVASISAQEVSA